MIQLHFKFESGRKLKYESTQYKILLYSLRYECLYLMNQSLRYKQEDETRERGIWYSNRSLDLKQMVQNHTPTVQEKRTFSKIFNSLKTYLEPDLLSDLLDPLYPEGSPEHKTGTTWRPRRFPNIQRYKKALNKIFNYGGKETD